MVKDKNKIGIFEWIFNYKKYSDEYIPLSKTVNAKKKEFEIKKQIVSNQLKKAEQDYVQKEIKLNLKIKNMQEELTKKTNRVFVLDKAVSDRNKEIQDLHKKLAETIVELENMKTSFNKLRGEIGGLTKEKNKLKSINEFMKKNRRSPSKEEIRSYICQRKEIEKRCKVKK